MKSLILYGRERLKNIGKADSLIRIGLFIIAGAVGTHKYGLYATAVIIFILYAAITLFEIVFSGKEIFNLNNLRKMNSVEQGRLFYHFIALIIVLWGMFYFQSRTVYVLTAALTIVLCFATGVGLLSTRFNK
ncbi:hypothetical protein [uncultured Pontibacter sp.]|uniref:hypothetical protein n=1 Tax=uncultured Pontibacter sp. TaxID=453356 RepID=UPI00262C7969|nr:hypothetical protein [uncultured Pontibacter sp.]